MDATSRDARERLPGWAWVAFGGALLVLLPLWLILTAAALQLAPDPSPHGLRRDGDRFGLPDHPRVEIVRLEERSWLTVWLGGARQGGLALLVLLGVVGVVLGVAAAVGRVVAWRRRRERATLDATVDPDAVLPEVTLRTGTIETYDPRR